MSFEPSILKNLKLNDKNAIITGGLGYLGIKIVETLLELDCNVIIVDLENSDTKNKLLNLNKKFNTKVDFYNLDLSKNKEINSFCEKIYNKYTRIDIIINNAALVGTSNLEGWCVPFEEQSMDTFDDCMQINTKSHIILIQKLCLLLKKSKNGKIINISSIYGNMGHDLKLYEDTNMGVPLAYSVSKAGLNITTKYLASLYGKNNICVNTIILGGIFRNQDQKFIEKYINKVPLNRMATENDIKGIIAFLSSNLSNYITGQDFVIDGGLTATI